jgi:uncharacterized protein (DUF2461 family)
MAIRLDDVQKSETIQLHVPSEMRLEFDLLRDRFAKERKDFRKALRQGFRDLLKELTSALDQATKAKPENHRNGSRSDVAVE